MTKKDMRREITGCDKIKYDTYNHGHFERLRIVSSNVGFPRENNVLRRKAPISSMQTFTREIFISFSSLIFLEILHSLFWKLENWIFDLWKYNIETLKIWNLDFLVRKLKFENFIKNFEIKI